MYYYYHNCCCARQHVSADDTNSVQHNKTLADYQKFDSEMSVVNVVWNDCKRLIETYTEQQVGSSVRLVSAVCLCL